MLATVQVGLIDNGRRLRDLSEAQVEALRSSIADVGLLNPITVFERTVIQGGVSVPGYGLVAGLHRLEAARRLGHETILANVVTLSELERQIAECDENLVGPMLSAADRARFTRRRKEAYEALHPETRNGVIGATARHAPDKLADASFTADTAKATGTSERTVQRDAERGEKVLPEVLDLIRGTSLDTGTYLDKLKRLPPNDQVTAARRDLSIEREQARASKAPAPDRMDIPAVHESLSRELDRQIIRLDGYDENALMRDLTADAGAHLLEQIGGLRARLRRFEAPILAKFPPAAEEPF